MRRSLFSSRRQTAPESTPEQLPYPIQPVAALPHAELWLLQNHPTAARIDLRKTPSRTASVKRKSIVSSPSTIWAIDDAKILAIDTEMSQHAAANCAALAEIATDVYCVIDASNVTSALTGVPAYAGILVLEHDPGPLGTSDTYLAALRMPTPHSAQRKTAIADLLTAKEISDIAQYVHTAQTDNADAKNDRTAQQEAIVRTLETKDLAIKAALALKKRLPATTSQPQQREATALHQAPGAFHPPTRP